MEKLLSSASIAIETLNLTHRYDDYLAVNQISFKVRSGEIFGLIGSNGAGKSTTIKMLTTLLPITCGHASIQGYDVAREANQVRQEIGYVPQLLSVDGDLTGYENLLLTAKLYGLCAKEREKKITEIIHLLRLEKVSNHLVKTYSGGMIRGLEIGQALIHQPPVLFLDEPTVGLDPAARNLIWKYLKMLNQSSGMTLFMSTHDMVEAEELCDLVALMHEGKIATMGTPKELKAKVGPKATLDDVFILYTGSSLKETEGYDQVKQVRQTISNL